MLQVLSHKLTIDVKHTPGHVEIIIIDHTMHLQRAPCSAAEPMIARKDGIGPGVGRLCMHAAVHVPRVFVSVVHSRRAREVVLAQMQALRGAAEIDDEGHFKVCVRVGEVRAASGDPHSKFVDALSIPVKRARTEQVCALDPECAEFLSRYCIFCSERQPLLAFVLAIVCAGGGGARG
jgi:hypothetical protein